MQKTLESKDCLLNDTKIKYDELVDIREVRLKEGATRLENAMYFLEQIKNPNMFRVGNDVVEVCCIGEKSLSEVLIRHFNGKRY